MSAIRLKKKLGQNVLCDNSIRDKIVAAVAVRPSDIVIEIGPGTGSLTFLLVRKALFLLAVEIDDRFCRDLRDRLRDTPNTEIRNADFLRINLQDEVARLRKRFPDAGATVIVSNLPFYITTPIVTKIIENRSLIDRCVLTVQKEVADRFTAEPGSKRYGAITLFLNYHAKVNILFPVPRRAFRPQPEVDGAVISIVPRAKPPVKVSDEKLFFRTIRAAFGQRRKMLRNSLLSLGQPQSVIEQALKKCGLEPTLRAERLSMKDFAALTAALSSASSEKAGRAGNSPAPSP